jgi:preprotein translocase subunit YajC
MLFMLLPLVVLVVIMFTSNRSQQKKQRDLESKLKKGDRILTQSGLVGKLVELEGRHARVEIAPGVKVQILKSAIAGLDTEDSASSSAKAKEAPKEAKEKDDG